MYNETGGLVNSTVRLLNMKKVIAFILVVLALSGCDVTSVQSSGGTYQEDFDALKMVEAKDGISQSEAYTIAKAFFWSNISGCGFPDEPSSEDEFWVSKTTIGYAGLPGDSIFIDKKTGTITWGDKTKTVTLEELKKTKSKNV
jgi:hypothetical protein